jgi:hypothetical protein
MFQISGLASASGLIRPAILELLPTPHPPGLESTRNMSQTHFALQSPRAPSRLPRDTSYITIIVGAHIRQKGAAVASAAPRVCHAALFAGLTFEMQYFRILCDDRPEHADWIIAVHLC